MLVKTTCGGRKRKYWAFNVDFEMLFFIYITFNTTLSNRQCLYIPPASVASVTQTDTVWFDAYKGLREELIPISWFDYLIWFPLSICDHPKS